MKKTKFRPLRDAKIPVETRVTRDIIGRWFIDYLTVYGQWERVRELLPSLAIVSVYYENERTARRIATWAKTHITTEDTSPVNIIILPPMSL